MEKKKKESCRMKNPVLDRIKDLPVEEDLLVEKATTRGSYVKVVLLLLALFIATGVSWFMQISPRSILLLVIAAFAVGVFICRNPEYSPAVSPLYVVMEGTVLGQLVKGITSMLLINNDKRAYLSMFLVNITSSSSENTNNRDVYIHKIA